MIVDGVITPDIVRSGIIDILLNMRYSRCREVNMYKDAILMKDKASRLLLDKYFEIAYPTSKESGLNDRALLARFNKKFGANCGIR